MQSLLTFKFRSAMPDAELIERMDGRRPLFREVDGLLQKYYCREPETGAFCGVYLFETSDQAQAYLDGKVMSSIRDALHVEGDMRVERIDLIMALRPDQYVAHA